MSKRKLYTLVVYDVPMEDIEQFGVFYRKEELTEEELVKIAVDASWFGSGVPLCFIEETEDE